MTDEYTKLITIVVAWLTTGGGIAILINWWTQKRKEPIDKMTAMIANSTAGDDSAVKSAREITKMSIEMYQNLNARLQVVEEDNEQLKNRDIENTRKFNILEKDFFTFKSFVKYWYSDLVANWEDHRKQTYPPPMQYEEVKKDG